MADDLKVAPSTAPAAKTVRFEEILSKLYQGIRLYVGVAGTATLVSSGAGVIDGGTIRTATASDDPLIARWDAGGATLDASVTRPSDTAAYVANDAWSNSTSAPAAGGYTLAGAARATPGSGTITDVIVQSSVDASTPLQGELWIFDEGVVNVNDNAAFSVSDADMQNLVGIIPFTLASTAGAAGSGNNAVAHIQGLSIGFTPIGSTDLKFLVKVKSAYVPVSGEILRVRAKVIRNT